MNLSPSDADERLETLELKVMELENTVAELNDVIIRQYGEIDLIKSAMKQLEQRLSSDAESSAGDPSQEPPPPHY